jgi:hypothetical protein
MPAEIMRAAKSLPSGRVTRGQQAEVFVLRAGGIVGHDLIARVDDGPRVGLSLQAQLHFAGRLGHRLRVFRGVYPVDADIDRLEGLGQSATVTLIVSPSIA